MEKTVVRLHQEREVGTSVIEPGEVYVAPDDVEFHVLLIAEDITNLGEYKIVYRRKGRLYVVPVELFERAITNGELIYSHDDYRDVFEGD